MSLVEIPTKDLPDYSFTVILDNVSYDFRLQWNGRDEAWYVYVGLSNQEFLVKTKLTSGTDVLSPYRAYDETPKGVLIALDKEKIYGRLARDSFSSGRFSLLYYTEDSVETLRESGLVR